MTPDTNATRQHAGLRSRNGQALVELAVFGSFILVVLGILINYGLHYDYRQQATMEAFRRSAATAAVSVGDDMPVSTTNLLIHDRYVPNPSDPFAVGSPVPVTAQAGVTRSHQLQLVPEKGRPRELPRLAIQVRDAAACPGGTRVAPEVVGGVLTCYYTTAGFRDEFNVPDGSMDRYEFIYGAQNVCDEPECGGGLGACLTEETAENPETGQQETTCVERLKHVSVMDSCEGEVISYEDCLRQAAQIVDNGTCEAVCLKAGNASSKCSTMCSREMEVPWYAQGAGCSGTTCQAPALDTLFGGARRMGLQFDRIQVANKSRFSKTEDAGGITSRTTVDVTTTATRPVIWVSGRTAATGEITAQQTDQPPTSEWRTSW